MLFEEIVLPILYRNNSNVDRTMIDERSNQYYNPNQWKTHWIEWKKKKKKKMSLFFTIFTSLIADIVLIWIVIVTLHASKKKHQMKTNSDRQVKEMNIVLCWSKKGRIRRSYRLELINVSKNSSTVLIDASLRKKFVLEINGKKKMIRCK